MKKLLLLLTAFPYAAFAQIAYPTTRTVDTIDIYHGVKVPDPYRWLEDDHSPETKAWVEAQNKVTFSYLEQIPFRQQMKERLEKVYNYPKYGSPFRKGGYYYFYKNNGLQNQSVLYRQLGPEGKPETVIDPNTLSADGTSRMMQFELSKDGKYGAYAVSKGGSDWEEIFVMDMTTLHVGTDHVEWVKVSDLAWQGNGFYYSRYPAPDKGKELSTKNENHQVYYHTVGTTQDKDLLVFEDKKNTQRFHQASTSRDEKYVFLNVSDRGKGLDGNALYFKTKEQKDFRPIISEITNSTYDIVDNTDSTFTILTNANTKNYKVVRFDIKTQKMITIIDEKPEPIQSIHAAGGKLFVYYLRDVASKLFVFSSDGHQENEVVLPGLGTVSGTAGDRTDKDIFYIYTSFTSPPTIYRYTIADRSSVVFRKPEVLFNPADFETKQIFYTSKDGTKVPMFIISKKGIVLNGTNPTLLYGYGGFNINLTPAFNPLLIPFIEAGGIYVQANLRGGGEYGEAWHQQGMKLKKQNVFDDFIAAAEYLVKEKYTDSKHLAVNGGSNGGLLIGAVINQRPDLFKVAIPQVGVMDMLRFQKFTIGWNWIADYGSSDSLADFNSLYKFSPLHNIKTNTQYPALLVTTSDHDDRVVPAHSFKYIATLQAVAGNTNKSPLLIRIETNSGHGASNTKKNIELKADIYSFIFYNMGITPR